jgi:hypothetical protein
MKPSFPNPSETLFHLEAFSNLTEIIMSNPLPLPFPLLSGEKIPRLWRQRKNLIEREKIHEGFDHPDKNSPHLDPKDPSILQTRSGQITLFILTTLPKDR